MSYHEEADTLDAKLDRLHDATLVMIEDKQAEQEGRAPNYYWRKSRPKPMAAHVDSALIAATTLRGTRET